MIDLTKPLQTKNGREVRIYAHEDTGYGHIHGAVKGTGNNNNWYILEWNIDGGVRNNTESTFNLVNVPETKTVWINVYDNSCACNHNSREEADALQSAVNQRVACIKVTYDPEIKNLTHSIDLS